MEQAEHHPDQGQSAEPARRDRREAALSRPTPSGDLDHPVVAGYDGSPSSRHALAYAAGMARRLGRPLLVAYICSPGIYCEPLTGQVIGAGRDAEEMERWLVAELDEVCDRAGLDVRILTRRGSPARELAGAAREFSADALVIGAPGHAWHHVAGSVPGWLARHAHCPVIVVP
jgi:nucleotide-binding universal stress UspA family protein